MSQEFNLPTSEPGLTVYGILTDSTSRFFNGTSFEAFSAGNFTNYDLSATEKGASGIYVIDMPALVTAAGLYQMFFYVNDTGSVAQGQRWLGSASVQWTGSEVATPAASEDVDLISLAELKEYLKVTSSNDNAILQTLITDVSAWIQNYLGRELVSTSYVEYYSGDGSSELILKNYPILSVSSVYIDDQREFGTSTVVDIDENLIVKKKQGILKSFNLLYGWTCGESNIKVTYTAGYTVGDDSGSGTMPHEIRLAVKRLIDHHYRIGYTARKLDYQSESISGMNLTFKDFDIPKDVKSMLDGWKKQLPAPQFEYAD